MMTVIARLDYGAVLLRLLRRNSDGYLTIDAVCPGGHFSAPLPCFSEAQAMREWGRRAEALIAQYPPFIQGKSLVPPSEILPQDCSGS